MSLLQQMFIRIAIYILLVCGGWLAYKGGWMLMPAILIISAGYELIDFYAELYQKPRK